MPKITIAFLIFLLHSWPLGGLHAVTLNACGWTVSATKSAVYAYFCKLRISTLDVLQCVKDADVLSFTIRKMCEGCRRSQGLCQLTPIARSPTEEFSSSWIVDHVFPAVLGLFALRRFFALFRHAGMRWCDLVWWGWTQWANALMKSDEPLESPNATLLMPNCSNQPDREQHVMLWGEGTRGQRFCACVNYATLKLFQIWLVFV